MDGVLLIDKSSGPTSHTVVARLRQTSGERSVGHTGTLDPLATGLLPLVMGRATRLAAFLSASDKTYEAVIQFGHDTDTDDADGQPLGETAATLPTDAEVDAALQAFRGTFEQVPPIHSAKRVAGEKAYALARRGTPVALAPVSVTVHELERLDWTGDRLTVRVKATAGFYVRSLARELGRHVGCGAHLAALRRTRSGLFTIAGAIPFGEAERMGRDIATRIVAPADALPQFPAFHLTDAGLGRAVHGNHLAPEHVTTAWTAAGPLSRVRLIGPENRLVAIAELRGDALHPVVYRITSDLCGL